MSIKNFIPTVWSENLLSALDQQYIAISNCNREFEGEIKEKGSSVKICGVNNITVSDYTKNSDMSAPQELSDTCRELIIDQAKCFNFQIDDIDRAQSTPRLMDAAMKSAANSLAKEADTFLYRLITNDGQKEIFTDVTEKNILDAILSCRERLYRNGVFDSSQVVIEISPAVATLLYKAKIDLSTNNQDLLENGCIGSIAGCKVFVTNNLTDGKEGEATYYDCVMRTKRAVAFAEQLSEIVAYRPEKRFADAVKGLHLYGAKVIYPNEMITMTICFPEVFDETV